MHFSPSSTTIVGVILLEAERFKGQRKMVLWSLAKARMIHPASKASDLAGFSG
jgi:hypothetical protein